jgi:hypothetical protein
LEGAAAYETFIKTLNVIISKYDLKAGRSTGTSHGVAAGDLNADGSNGNTGGSQDTYDVGGGSHGGGAHGGVQYDPPLYDPNKHYTEYSVGDLVRLPNGDIYRVKDLSQVYHAPDSEYGHLGWEKV